MLDRLNRSTSVSDSPASIRSSSTKSFITPPCRSAERSSMHPGGRKESPATVGTCPRPPAEQSRRPARACGEVLRLGERGKQAPRIGDRHLHGAESRSVRRSVFLVHDRPLHEKGRGGRPSRAKPT